MDQQRLRELIRKLTGSPFFPILFISKAVEEAAYFDPMESLRMGLLALVATVLWLYTSEDVKWGLYKAAEKAEEAVEEATDGDNT